MKKEEYIKLSDLTELSEILEKENFIKIEISRSYLRNPNTAIPWETIWTTETGSKESINKRIKELWEEF